MLLTVGIYKSSIYMLYTERFVEVSRSTSHPRMQCLSHKQHAPAMSIFTLSLSSNGTCAGIHDTHFLCQWQSVNSN